MATTRQKEKELKAEIDKIYAELHKLEAGEHADLSEGDIDLIHRHEETCLETNMDRRDISVSTYMRMSRETEGRKELLRQQLLKSKS